MGTSGTGHDRCPSQFPQPDMALGTPPRGSGGKIKKPVFGFKGVAKNFLILVRAKVNGSLINEVLRGARDPAICRSRPRRRPQRSRSAVFRGRRGMTAPEPALLFPLRQIEARQFVRIRREVELLGIAVGGHIGVQRQEIGLLGHPLDRRRIGLVADLGVVG